MSVSFKDRLCWWRKIRIGKGAGGDRDHVRFAGGPPEDGAAAVRAKMECHVISAVRGPGVSCAVSEDLHFGLRVEGGDAEIPACTAWLRHRSSDVGRPPRSSWRSRPSLVCHLTDWNSAAGPADKPEEPPDSTAGPTLAAAIPCYTARPVTGLRSASSSSVSQSDSARRSLDACRV